MSYCRGVPSLEGVLSEEENEEETTEEESDVEERSGEEENCPELSALQENPSDNEDPRCKEGQQYQQQDQYQQPFDAIRSSKEERTSARDGINAEPTQPETKRTQLKEHGTIWNQAEPSRTTLNQKEPKGTICHHPEDPRTPNNSKQHRHDPSEPPVATHTGTNRNRLDDPGKTSNSKSSRKVKLLPSPRVGVALDDGRADLTPRAPSPSQIIWRPVMPGYTAATSPSGGDLACGSPVVIQRTIEIHRSVDQPEVGLKQAIPAMPMYLAITCLVFNVISPGLGNYTITGTTVQGRQS